MESICEFCNYADKQRCRTENDALSCDNYSDFGFSFLHAEEMKKDETNQIEKMYATIMPLLNNLEKNPEKDTIYWPNRVEKIQQFKKKLQSIKEGKK